MSQAGLVDEVSPVKEKVWSHLIAAYGEKDAIFGTTDSRSFSLHLHNALIVKVVPFLANEFVR